MAGPYAIRGLLYIGSITGATGTSGTLLKGLEAQEIDIRPRVTAIEKRIPNARLDPIGTAVGEAAVTVALRLRGHDSDSVNQVLGWYASGGAMSTNNVSVGGRAGTTALIVRPVATSELYFYTPAAALLRVDRLGIQYSHSKPVFEDIEAEFLCCIAIGAPTEPAAMWASSSALNTAYAALS